jgi:catechol 2,3-dioxygenase-like lactoylglutathione lyase family enzyme
MTTSLTRALALFFCLINLTALAADHAARPPITGISHMCVYTSDAKAADNFYAHILGATKGTDPQDEKGTRYYFSPTQFVEVLPLPAQHTINRMACVAYNTSDAEGLHQYLSAQHVDGITEVRAARDGSRWFQTKDPEGNQVQFMQPAIEQGKANTGNTGGPIATRIIHVGYLVHSKKAEDHFYRDILGFRPYWFGAMQPGHVDWISQQVPDGHDWLEYMMVGDGSTVPLEKIDQRQLGVLNHFSLGVANMEQAVTTLTGEDRLSPRHDGPSMGKDGKWQANFYDPDGTRVELMEFQPVIKPCCSDFTAESPAN